MKAPSKVIQSQLEKGKPLSNFAVDKLRNAGQEDALKANAHNIVLAMLEGKSITQIDLNEALKYYPEQANQWLQSGGTVKEQKSVAEWTSIYRIAKELGVSEQSIHQMIKRHVGVAPRPNSQGKYNRNEVIDFFENRSTLTSRASRDYKQKILEQEYRLKKVKADEAEDRVMAKDAVLDILTDADITLESVVKSFAKRCARDKDEYEVLIQEAKIAFKRWRDFITSLS